LADSLGLRRPIIKSHPEEKRGWPWAREPPKNFGFPYNISATVGASDFKFGAQPEMPRPIIKSHTEERVGMALG